VKGGPWNTTVIIASPYNNHGVPIIRMRWGKMFEIDANEDSQLVAASLQIRAAYGVTEALADPILSWRKFRHETRWKEKGQMTHTKSATDAIETGSTAMRALGVGAFALGAAAIGAIAVGAIAIGRLRILEARVEKLAIGTLTVEYLNLLACRSDSSGEDDEQTGSNPHG